MLWLQATHGSLPLCSLELSMRTAMDEPGSQLATRPSAHTLGWFPAGDRTEQLVSGSKKPGL